MFQWLKHVFFAGREAVSLPLLIWVVVISTFATFSISGIQIAGFNLSGLAWVITLGLSALVMSSRARLISLPVWIVVPWCILLLSNWLGTEYPSEQRTAQLLCPLFVGAATSSLTISEAQLRQFSWLLRVASLIALIAVLLTTGIVATGSLPEVTALAPQVMTVGLLCCYFAARHAENREPRELVVWGLLALVPIIGVTRTGVVAVLLTLPLTLAPLGLTKRLTGMGAVAAAGLLAFYTTIFQQKMFESGEGTLSDVLEGDYRDSGRKYMWDIFEEAIRNDPWLARGTGAGEDLSWRITEGMSGYPHNDWLLLSYDYGVDGATLYLLTLIALALHAYLRARRAHSPEARVLFFAGASAFVPFAAFMFTDNISIYVSFFGNLHFAILGLAYAALRTEGELSATPDRLDYRDPFANPRGRLTRPFN